MCFSLFIPANNQSKVYAASSAGLLVSNNSGDSWLQQDVTNRGLNFTMVRNVGIIQNTTKKYIFAGTSAEASIVRRTKERTGKEFPRESPIHTNLYYRDRSKRTIAPCMLRVSNNILQVDTNGGDEWSELLKQRVRSGLESPSRTTMM